MEGRKVAIAKTVCYRGAAGEAGVLQCCCDEADAVEPSMLVPAPQAKRRSYEQLGFAGYPPANFAHGADG